MQPYLNFLGREIPTFGIMVLLGIGAGSLTAYLNCKINRINYSDPMLTACMAFAGAVIGSKILKPLINIPSVIINWERYAQVPVGDFLAWFFGETVFYGGLLGGFAGAYIFCKCFKVPFLKMADILAPAIPIGHAFGRIGCLLGGCCYGLEVSASNPFSIIYPERTDVLAELTAPVGIPLLALPIIEAAGNLLIAVIVLIFGRIKLKKAYHGRCIALYLLMYAVQRFVLEFYRGDLVRGVYRGISTSQIISIAIIIFVMGIFIFGRMRKKVR
jgi:phosphatidylglycerol:prolipoprotein diacylglycerol transferase